MDENQIVEQIVEQPKVVVEHESRERFKKLLDIIIASDMKIEKKEHYKQFMVSHLEMNKLDVDLSELYSSITFLVSKGL